MRWFQSPWSLLRLPVKSAKPTTANPATPREHLFLRFRERGRWSDSRCSNEITDSPGRPATSMGLPAGYLPARLIPIRFAHAFDFREDHDRLLFFVPRLTTERALSFICGDVRGIPWVDFYRGHCEIQRVRLDISKTVGIGRTQPKANIIGNCTWILILRK